MVSKSIAIKDSKQLYRADIGTGYSKCIITSIELLGISDTQNLMRFDVKYQIFYESGDTRTGPVKLKIGAKNGKIEFDEPQQISIYNAVSLHFSIDIIRINPKNKGDFNPNAVINYELIGEEEDNEKSSSDNLVQLGRNQLGKSRLGEETIHDNGRGKITANYELPPEEDEMSNSTVVIPLSELNSIADQFHAEGRTVYAVGSTWGSEDQTSRFLENNIWENEDDTDRGNIVNQVEIDDVLIMKSTFQRKGVGIFRVKALGRVLKNYNNGSKLDVDWFYKVDNLDFEGELSKFRYRISSLNLDKYSEIFNYLDQGKLSKIYESVPKPAPTRETKIVRNLIKAPSFNNDGAKGQDLLGFNLDVRSFAALISHKKIKPPIAIALFGEWGSGKSFFMNKLETEIKNHSFLKSDQIDKSSYVNGIAHIKFNAWSYMDANLWAGLSHSLFEKLNEYITQNTKGDIERLKVTVRIAKRLENYSSEKKELVGKKKNLEKLKLQLAKEKEYRILSIFRKDYDGPISTFLKKAGLKEDEILQLTPSKIKERIEGSIDVFSYTKRNLFQYSAITVSMILVLFMFKELLGNFWAWINAFWTNYIAIIIPLIYPIINFFSRKRKALASTLVLIDQLNAKTKNKNKDENIKTTFEEIAKIEKLEEEVEQSINRTSGENSNITQIAIANFVANQTDSEAYKKHLGIITTIRKDFETLSELFTESIENKVKEEDSYDSILENDRSVITEAFKEDKELKRIVLYIDDLDRCSNDKVIEVLEAVNLLMAFPLFVVVVGVDPRWVNNALIQKHNLHFNGVNDEKKDNAHYQKVAVSDYLEKIFQIPFHIRKPTNDDAREMISHLFRDEVEKEAFKYSAQKAQEHLDMTDEDAAYAEIEQFKEEATIATDLRELQSKEFQKLILSQEEFKYLKEMIWLIDNSPRSIKRFANIYRLIRSHEALSFNESNKNKDFLIIIFVLGVSIGTYKKSVKELLPSVLIGTGKTLAEVLNEKTDYKPILVELEKNKEISILLKMKCEYFNKYIPFIKRFSFENDIIK